MPVKGGGAQLRVRRLAHFDQEQPGKAPRIPRVVDIDIAAVRNEAIDALARRASFQAVQQQDLLLWC